MTNLINICSFWEYRYSKWRHWSRVNRILCWIKIGIILVEKDGLEFLMPQLWWSVHKHPKIYTSSCLQHWSIYVRSEKYRYSTWRHWSRVHQILCWIEIGLILVEKDGLEFLQPQHWCSVHSKHRDFTNLPDDQFDRYMFLLRISTFAMTVLLSCTSNTMLDRNRS